MKDKKWVDCPVCGSKGTMKFRRGVNHEVKDFIVKGLSGYFCNKCKDGFFNIASENKIQAEVNRHRALLDAKKITAAELILVEELARKWKKSRQRIHQMMDAGKIHYVFIGNQRFPLREELHRFKA